MIEASNPVLALGRDLVQNLLVALRSGQLYELDNATLRAASERLARTVSELHRMEGPVRLEAGRDAVQVNRTRIRSELRQYTVHQNLLRFLQALGIGGFEWLEAPARDGTARFAHVVGRLEAGEGSAPEAVEARLAEAGVQGVVPLPPREEADETLTENPDARARAERTYRHGVAVTRDFMESLRSGRSMRTSRVRRAVQGIVDQVLEDETLLVGLTNLRDYDEPTFTHSVNVCVFSVSLGQRIGLSRFELYDLGIAALLHDIGKVDVSPEILRKTEALDHDEWEEMQSHTRFGVLRLLEERPRGQIPIREILVAFEHHLNVDLSGYPRLSAPRRLSFYSKIVAICDAFDAGTTPRVYKTDPITPPEMLEVLMRWQGARFDPILVKAFVAMLGIYPPGSFVLLDTMEMGVVVASNPDPARVNRPRLKIVADRQGHRVEGPVVDLDATDPTGQHERTIIKVLDPDRYGIEVGRHFLAP